MYVCIKSKCCTLHFSYCLIHVSVSTHVNCVQMSQLNSYHAMLQNIYKRASFWGYHFLLTKKVSVWRESILGYLMYIQISRPAKHDNLKAKAHCDNGNNGMKNIAITSSVQLPTNWPQVGMCQYRIWSWAKKGMHIYMHVYTYCRNCNEISTKLHLPWIIPQRYAPDLEVWVSHPIAH